MILSKSLNLVGGIDWLTDQLRQSIVTEIFPPGCWGQNRHGHRTHMAYSPVVQHMNVCVYVEGSNSQIYKYTDRT